MRRFFETHKLDNACLPEERVKMIRLSVLSRVKEKQQMRKRFKIKPLIIAAAAIATMAASAVTVNALSSGKDAIFKFNGKEVDANSIYTSYVDENGRTVEIYLIEYPEEILVDPPSDREPGPVGELKAVYDYSSFNTNSVYIGVIDETGKEFIMGKCGKSFFGKDIYFHIKKEGEPTHTFSWGYGEVNVDPEYDYDFVLDLDKKIFTMEYHKNLFNTIGDFFESE